ncbi:MAG: 1-acyl-sn-glycerol-3-phosphate acyltransferase [Brumimicrobium sp.]
MMRPLYLFLKFLLRITLWIYYPRFKTINSSPKRYNSTIYMCNHAASFMDPLVIAGPQRPIVFFMTRADIYKGIMKQIFWAAHMLPIYRQQDGGNVKDNNLKVFKETSRLLKKGRNILIFAEGFTDDDFIRRLKPIKKGSVKMGFEALESINWSKEIYVQAVGINYTHRNVLGSGIIISNGNSVCLNAYRDEYKRDPIATIINLSARLEKEMQEQITYVKSKKMAPFHENVMRITRKGMNAIDSDKRIPLIERWEYSRNLANWMNENKVENNEEIMQLKERLESYFAMQEEVQIEETPFYNLVKNKRYKWRDILYLVLLAPLAMFSHIFTFIPVRFIKNFVEKSFKRSVFWGSVKMLLGAAAVGVYNLILLAIVSWLTGLSYLMLLVIGLIVVPVNFVLLRNWQRRFKLHRQMNRLSKENHGKIAHEREIIEAEIKRLIPVS